MHKTTNDYLLQIDKINSEFHSFADYVSKEIFIYYLQFLKEEHTFDFNPYIHLSPTGDKTVHLILLCDKKLINFVDHHRNVSYFYIQKSKLPTLPTSNIQPINDFIPFYINNHRRISNYVSPYTYNKQPSAYATYYDTQYGTIYFDKYSLAIEDNIIKFTWLIPDSLHLLKLLEAL